MTGVHHLYAHTPNQVPHKGIWLLSVPRGTLSLWLPLAIALLKTNQPHGRLVSAVDEPPA